MGIRERGGGGGCAKNALIVLVVVSPTAGSDAAFSIVPQAVLLQQYSINSTRGCYIAMCASS